MIQIKDGDIILDPYAGSGTTVEAILNVRRKKNISLHWLAIQQEVPLKKEHPMWNKGFHNICDILRHRIKFAHQKHLQQTPEDYSVWRCTNTRIEPSSSIKETD